jgi:hypothetical protein
MKNIKAGLLNLLIIILSPNILLAESTSQREMNKTINLEKKYQILYQPFGSSPLRTSSQAIEFGYALNTNQIIYAELSTGNGDSSLSRKFAIAIVSLLSTDKETRESKSAGIHFKQFLGDSFYSQAGINYNTLKYNYNWTDKLNNNGEYSFDGTSSGVSLKIGNQWRWDSFSLDINWLSLYLPVFASSTNESINSFAASQSNIQNRIQDDKDDNLKRINYGFFTLKLGWSF